MRSLAITNTHAGLKRSTCLAIVLTLILLCTAVLAPKATLGFWDPQHVTSSLNQRPASRNPQVRGCGYDPTGAADEWLRHVAHKTRAGAVQTLDASTDTPGLSADIGDTAVIVDNGSLVLPANAFDLKSRSITFNPGGDGYQIFRSDQEF